MMQRAVRTPAAAILRTVRDDRHFGAIDEDPLPERPSTEPRYTRLSPEKRLRLAVLRFRDRGATSPSSPRRGRSVARIRRLGLAIRLCERLRDAESLPGLHPSRHPAVGRAPEGRRGADSVASPEREHGVSSDRSPY